MLCFGTITLLGNRILLKFEILFFLPIVSFFYILHFFMSKFVSFLCAADVAHCRFGSLLASETFHADLHAGNLLLLKDGRVRFIDFG